MDINIATSEWSNGCESGWTVYLQESYITRNDSDSNSNVVHPQQSYRLNSAQNYDDDNGNDNDEEDLSMVSDASSGPPHFHLQEDLDQQSYNNNTNCCYYYSNINSDEKLLSKKGVKKSSKENKKASNKNKQYQHQHQHQHQQYYLDDTASSPASRIHSQMYDSPSNNMGFSHQNFSTTQFEGNSSYSNPYALWPSHVQETDYSANPAGHQLSGSGW